MLDRLAAVLGFFGTNQGSVPPKLRLLVAGTGIIIELAALVILFKMLWDSELTELSLAAIIVFALLGLTLIRSGVKANSDPPKEK